MKGVWLALALLLLPSGMAAAAPCETLVFEDKDYFICLADPRTQDIRTAWLTAEGEPFGGLAAFAADASEKGEKLLFAMNGGMYHPDMRPVGLFVQDGIKKTPLSTGCGRQNFNMCPNGVFYISNGKAGVMETKRFGRAKLAPDFATQSGPMLVINGKLHPKFQAGSTSRKIRNGVGVRPDGKAVFAISDDYVTFHEFARLFRDQLKTPNALFLDGTISSLHADSVGRADSFWPVGPIIAVTERP